MKYLGLCASLAGLLAGAPTLAQATTFAKPGAYTLTATVRSVSSATLCPYAIGAATENLPGYSGFVGFTQVGPSVYLKGAWVIGISPTNGQQKYAYTLAKAKSANTAALYFIGSVTYGGVSDQFSANSGTYRLAINPSTLAGNLTVVGTNCTISYSVTFTRGIPSKFLNLL